MRTSILPRFDRRAAALLLVVPACTAITHAGDYATQAQDDVCRACPASASLRRPPCPSASTPPSDTTSATYFALRTLDFGEDPSTWHDPSRVVGLNLDCSDRVATNGAPALCNRATAPSADDIDWVPLPLGVDNAFGVDLLGRFASDPALDVRPSVGATADLAQGAWGIVLAIDGWNGLPDDDVVGARLLFARGVTGGGAPKWDGTDRWDVYSPGVDAALAGLAVPDATFKGGSAYVTGGVLVWDARSIQGATIRFQNHGASIETPVTGAIFVGALAKSGVSNATLAGAFSGASYTLSYSFVAGCDPSLSCAAASSGIGLGLSDLPTAGQATSAQCHALSFGVAMELAPIAGYGALVSDAPVDGPCDFATPCEASDASTE